MVDNTVILDTVADLLLNLGYKQTYNDVEIDKTNIMGLYLREAGNPIGTLSDQNKIQRVDLNIRLHGDITTGSIKKCEQDLIKITKLLTICNREYTGFKILSSSLRGRGRMLGKTSKNIPVFNISFLITFN